MNLYTIPRWKTHLSGKTTFIILGLAFSPLLAQAQLFISNGDAVSLYDDQGNLINSDFASVQGATGLAVGPDGNLYVGTADPADGLGAEIDSFNATTGTPVGTPFVSHVTDSALNNPGGMAFGPNGNLYVSDLTAGAILVYNQSGTDINQLSSLNLNTPSSVAFNSAGTLFTSDINGGNILSYSSGIFSIVNNPAVFSAPDDVAVGLNGNLYVLDISGATGGIYELNPTTGQDSEIVNYSTSPFFANNLTVGPDGKLYVSGVDSGSGNGEILDYAADGSSEAVFANLGPGATPTFLTFAVPEPSPLALSFLGGIALMTFVVRRQNSIKKWPQY